MVVIDSSDDNRRITILSTDTLDEPVEIARTWSPMIVTVSCPE